MGKKTLKIETVHQCNCCLGNKTLHPLVSVIDLSKASPTDYGMKLDFYTILLIEQECDGFAYGRKYYDYSSATLVFLSPGQSIRMNENEPLPKNGWLLVFHPHLIGGTTLGMNINNYTFFSYQAEEALHLSLREKTKVMECLANIGQELLHAIDRHSKTLISRYIELLLDHCSRFYERQFITRNEANKQILGKMESLLDDYIQSGQLKSHVLPSAEYCSGRLHLSPHYFRDLLKFETGRTIDGYFQLKRIDAAKKMLLDKDSDVSLVAEKLGFPSVRHFSNVFQKMTGVTPGEYRLALN